MRYANISTTMNIYGRALPQVQREANNNVVVMYILEVRKDRR